MAFVTKVLIAVSLIAVAQAAYASSFAGGYAGAGGNQGLGYGFVPSFPSLPGFGFLGFPTIHVPSPSDIGNIKPADGQTFSGIAVESTNKVTTDKDGNVVRTGGTKATTNENGVVNTYQVGDVPQDSVVLPTVPEVVMPEFPTFEPFSFEPFEPIIFHDFEPIEVKPFKPHTFKPFKPVTFKPFKPVTFKPITFKPIVQIDPEEIRNYQPGENEHFVATHTSSFSQFSDIDGVKSNSGGSQVLVNNNGDVEEENVQFNQHDDDAKETEDTEEKVENE